MSNSILLVDDDIDYLNSLKRALTSKRIKEKIYIASSENQSLKIFQKEHPLVVILDLELDNHKGVESGYSLLKTFLNEDNTSKIIILTGHTSSEYGIKAIKLGASNFLKKPTDINHLEVLINDAVSQSLMLRENKLLKNKTTQNNLEQFVIGESNEIKKIRDEILFLGQNNSPVLIQGETGTGKGLIAKAIHLFGKLKDAPFVRYQPNYLSNDLSNSDFFGHKKGAFTGAIDDKKGLLELANTGTFFLDEVSLLPLEIQVTLLTSLQEQKFRKIGDTKEINVNFRLICATNEDIENAIKNQKLRLDFYHRIAYANIVIPPLRKRINDIKILALHFFNELSKKEDILIQDIDKKALEKLKSYPWKGNVRELEAVIQMSAYKANFSNKRIIQEGDIMFAQKTSHNTLIEPSTNNIISDNTLTFKEKINLFKKTLVQNELKQHNYNQALTAKCLGIDRTTLIRIISKAQ